MNTLFVVAFFLTPGGSADSPSTSLADSPQDDQAVPVLRGKRYTQRSPAKALMWQEELRRELRGLLKLGDLLRTEVALDPKVLTTRKEERYTLREVEISATAGRRIKVVVTTPVAKPAPAKAAHPAVVCIHGHGGNRHVVYDRASVYRGFAAALAENGVVTVAADVGQHKVYETGRTLMGERLWDLMRCIDYLETLPQVDRSRIGCGGLSLGGEMAMWLGALDKRVAATVSSGFLTIMDQMEKNHCMCWKFRGLRELVDYADIYSLIAPRPLQCQNGLKEGPKAFCVPLARQAMGEIRRIYADLKAPENAELAVHKEGHVIDLPALTAFFKKHLKIR